MPNIGFNTAKMIIVGQISHFEYFKYQLYHEISMGNLQQVTSQILIDESFQSLQT
jgi:hypothetical protein